MALIGHHTHLSDLETRKRTGNSNQIKIYVHIQITKYVAKSVLVSH